MISNSEKLWEGLTRGVVLKCNDELMAKIIGGNSDYTEYTSIQNLAQHAPDIPAPKPHGLVKFSSASIIFMTYFPSRTLEQAWAKLTNENKVLVQHQLNGIFSRLRMLKNEGGHRLGGRGWKTIIGSHTGATKSSLLPQNWKTSNSQYHFMEVDHGSTFSVASCLLQKKAPFLLMVTFGEPTSRWN